MKSSTFQIILLSAFGFFILAGVAILALTKGQSGSATPVTVWGAIDQQIFTKMVSEAGIDTKSTPVVYSQKNPATFDQDLLEALAGGAGPDAVVISQDMLGHFEDKILPIPYGQISDRTFKDTFIQEAEIYLTSAGILALPLSIDPLVMYWNRNMFSNAGIAAPPKYWDEFYNLAKNITVKGTDMKIQKSAAGLGEFANISNGKEIISAMIMQAGSDIVDRDSSGRKYAALGQSSNAQSAVSFYSDFANNLKPNYSWSRALPSSKNMFIAGDLATYFGFASEFADLKNKTPNLDFDVIAFPQIRSASAKMTFGKMQGAAVLKSARNPNGAFAVVSALSGAPSVKYLSEQTNLPPPRRDLLSQSPANDANAAIFYSSALISRAWLDPSPTDTSGVFKDMIEGITSGRLRVSEAVDQAGSRISDLLR